MPKSGSVSDLTNAYPSLTPLAINAVLTYVSDAIANESIIAVT